MGILQCRLDSAGIPWGFGLWRGDSGICRGDSVGIMQCSLDSVWIPWGFHGDVALPWGLVAAGRGWSRLVRVRRVIDGEHPASIARCEVHRGLVEALLGVMVLHEFVRVRSYGRIRSMSECLEPLRSVCACVFAN